MATIMNPTQVVGLTSKAYDMTLAEYMASTILVTGDVVTISDLGNSRWDIATGVSGANGYNVRANTAATLKATLRTGKTLHFQAYGGSTSNSASVNTTIIQLMITHAIATAYSEPNILIDGGTYSFQYIDLTNVSRVTFVANGTVTINGTDPSVRNFVIGSTNYDTWPSVGVTGRVRFTGGQWLIGAVTGGGTPYTYVGRLEGFVLCEMNFMSFSGSCGATSGADKIGTYMNYSYANVFNECTFSSPGVPSATYYSYSLYLDTNNNNINHFNTCRTVGVIGSPTEARTVGAKINGSGNVMTSCDVSASYFGLNINGSRGGTFTSLYSEYCTECVTTGPAGIAGIAYGNLFTGGIYEVLTNGYAFRLGINGGAQNTTIINPRIKGETAGSNRTFIDQGGTCYGLSVINPDLTNIDTTLAGTYRGDIGGGLSMGVLQAHWLSFPITQVSSTNAYTLDDYRELTWTPVLTFATPGDVAVTYSIQVGAYTKIGRLVKCAFRIVTSAFTHTTASGNLQITGLPVAVRTATNLRFTGSVFVGGVTKATYTQFNCVADSATSLLTVLACGSAVAPSNVAAADVPTGGSVVLTGEIEYESA